MTSGAPLTRRTCAPSVGACKVAMKRCSDSNGMASTRGYAACSAWRSSPLGGERIERPLGGIAFHFPDSLLAAQLRIVAEHGNAAHDLQHGVRAGRPPVLLHLALAV